MGQDEGQEPTRLVAADEGQKSPEQLRTEIEEVRGDLGETTAALAAKTDVKARAREKADDVKHTAAVKKDELLSKVRHSTPGGGSSAATGGPSAAIRIRTKAQQNPVPTAALTALAGGFLLGRLSRRPDS
jgi:hypothetical protein